MAVSKVPEIRNLKFDIDESVPRRWHKGGQAITSFFDNLSIFFPPGERFFIASLIAHRDRVRDERLLDEIRAFCGQEGIHSREHVRYNAMLEAKGYPASAMEARVRKLLARVEARIPARRRLAVTCALEHFTASMGHILLSDPRILEGAHPTMAALWRWHAVEETEHKGTAFDVYRAAGGGYGERIAMMLGATVIFWAKVVEHQLRLMKKDGIHLSRDEWTQLLRWIFADPGWAWPLLRMYADYFRPGFHPWDFDNRDLVESWKAAWHSQRTDADEAPSAGSAS